MALRIEQLKKTLIEAKQEAAAWKILCEQLKILLGPTFNTIGKINMVAEDADLRLESLARKGRFANGEVPQQLLESFCNHPNFNVRKVVARLAPVGSQLQLKFLNDISPAVRSVAAQSVPLKALSEAVKKFAKDDNMVSIHNSRLLKEEHQIGFDSPELAEKPGSAVKDEFSDAFYENIARRLFNEYDGNLEYTWEELSVRNYCNAMWTTSRVYVDPKRLYKQVMKIIANKNDIAMDLPRVTLREVSSRLLGEESVFVVSDVEDPREELIGFTGSDREFMNKFYEIYAIKESQVPAALRKRLLSEDMNFEMRIPMMGKSPCGKSLDHSDEKLLDRFVETWNRVQASQGEPLLLNWVHGVTDSSRVSFGVVLK